VAEFTRTKKFEIDKLKNSHDIKARARAAAMVEQEKEDDFVRGGFNGVLKWKVNIKEVDDDEVDSVKGVGTLFSPMKPTDKLFGYHRVKEQLDKGVSFDHLAPLPGELDVEGDIALRQQMQQKFRMEQYRMARAKKEEQLRKKNLLMMKGATFNQEEADEMAYKAMRRQSHSASLMQRGIKDTMARMDPANESGDDLYARYMNSLDDRKNVLREQEKQKEALQAKIGNNKTESRLFMTDLSDEDVYLREKYNLAELLHEADHDVESSELNDGVLYYRVRNQLNVEDELDSDDDMPDANANANNDSSNSDPGIDMANQKKGVDTDRYPSAASILTNPARSKQELRTFNAAAQRKASKSAHPVHIGRLKRTTKARDLEVQLEEDEPEYQYAKTLGELYAAEDGSDSKELGNSLAADAKKQTRVAADFLLMAQLETGTLPERLFKQNEKINKTTLAAAAEGKYADEPSLITVNLTGYGIGDKQGNNLGLSLDSMPRLETLLLSENRLTHRSMPQIFRSLSHEYVRHIDISGNKLRGSKHAAVKAIAKYFTVPNGVQHLNVSNCCIDSEDIKILCSGFSSLLKQHIEEFVADSNDIGHAGACVLADYLSVLMTAEMDPKAYGNGTIGKPVSRLLRVSLAWNNITAVGAVRLAEAIEINTSIKNIDLTANAISDKGAQRLAAAIPLSNSMEILNLSQNYVSSPSCFVFARVLRGHPSMKVLNLNRNPLGEPGARSIFRTIMKGLRCFVMMGGCTFPLDPTMFNHNNPTMDSPYSLDLSQPYQASIFHNLLDIVEADPSNCRFHYVTITDPRTGNKNALAFTRNDENHLCEKGKDTRYKPPSIGTVDVHINYNERIPTLSMAAKDSSLAILEIIIVTAKSESDQLNWLGLLCCDLYFTCAQAQNIIDNFMKKNVIGIGGLKKNDVIKQVWSRLLDTQNKIDFLMYNLPDESHRTQIINYFGFDMFKFNWTNPSGHWRFNLDLPAQRNTFMKFVALNRLESQFSETKSGRDDTSQAGDWFNFRNASYNGQSNLDAVMAILHPKDVRSEDEANGNPNNTNTTDAPPLSFAIDREFVENVPYRGVIEFDYVSTRRPEQESLELKEEKGLLVEVDDFDMDDIPVTAEDAAQEDLKQTNRVRSESGEGSDLTGKRKSSITSNDSDHKDSDGESDSSHPPLLSKSKNNRTLLKSKWMTMARDEKRRTEEFRPDPGRKDPKDMILSDEDMYDFLRRLGLSSRERCSPSECIFKLLYLQVAVTKYYLLASQVNSVLETFPRDAFVQSRVVCALFSRVYDLHNMDIVLRPLWPEAQNDVIYRLGFLNVMNPLKPALDYEIHMLHQDNRRMLVYLLELAPSEAVNQLKEDLRSDIIITDLYGSLNRVIKNCTDQMVMFNYGDFNERSPAISWNLRRDGLKRFLVGTKPMSRDIFGVIRQYYKLMQKPDQLTMGSIEVQYTAMVQKSQDKMKAAPLINKLRRFRKQSGDLSDG
jgi:hypothetical protein